MGQWQVERALLLGVKVYNRDKKKNKTKTISVFSDTRHDIVDGTLLLFFVFLTGWLSNELCERYGAWPTHFVCMHVTEFCNVSYRLINSIQCSLGHDKKNVIMALLLTDWHTVLPTQVKCCGSKMCSLHFEANRWQPGAGVNSYG